MLAVGKSKPVCGNVIIVGENANVERNSIYCMFLHNFPKDKEP